MEVDLTVFVREIALDKCKSCPDLNACPPEKRAGTPKGSLCIVAKLNGTILKVPQELIQIHVDRCFPSPERKLDPILPQGVSPVAALRSGLQDEIVLALREASIFIDPKTGKQTINIEDGVAKIMNEGVRMPLKWGSDKPFIVNRQ